MVEPTRLSLNTATVRERWTLRQCIEGCVRHGIGGIAPWRDMLAACGVDEATRLIAGHGLTVTGLCRGGMFPAETAEGRRQAIDDNLRAIDEAAAIGAKCLVLVVGSLPQGSRDIAGARAQVRDGIAAVLDHARAARVPLAIEPLHPMYAGDRSCVNTMAEANALCEELGEGVGIALDVYHVWWDSDLSAQITRAGRNRLLAFHVCDWLVPTRDLLLDRGMMGDGVIDIPAIRAQVEAIGYDGFVEVEIFSHDRWWREDPDLVLGTMVERARTCV
ncbi:sugar phosphate isomerase/epimerase family protein [Aquamicrobium terrae]|uniref:Sugar phosphate isomerase/epimerase n=1 Tax=Aquamicrobium terrae TaxID=1324945 RepID=A0ABV2MWR8_9HYPH